MAQPWDCKINRYVTFETPWGPSGVPIDIDYETGLNTALQKVVTKDAYGRITAVDYQFSGESIVSEAWAWALTPVGDPASVTVTVTYHREDGSAHPHTPARTLQFANEDSTIAERKERIAVVENVKSQLMALSDEFGQTPTQARAKLSDFVRTFNQEIFLFEQIYSDDLATAINADATIGWLDQEYPTGSGVTIRERLVTRFTPPPP